MSTRTFWSQRISALQNIWSADACGRRHLSRPQRDALSRMLASARSEHAAACRQAVA